ncbi:hypothetical protein TNCV_4419111 [Trichonephila clavipes]|nr:hypothetical protein TNCV_4419111 [Trichonephila clavipes]
MSYQSQLNSPWQGAKCTPVVNHSFEHQTLDRTIWLGSVLISRENTLGVVRVTLPLFPFYRPHERTCGSTAIRLSPCRKCTIHLQIPVPSPEFKSRLNGRAVSATNLYTGWTAMS